jgi:hypothetical protein
MEEANRGPERHNDPGWRHLGKQQCSDCCNLEEVVVVPARLRRSPLFPSLLACIAFAAPHAAAQAAPTTFHVHGTVTSASFPDYHVAPGAAAGDAITGDFTYDPAAGSLQTAPSAFDFSVGQLRFRSGPAGLRVTSGLDTGPFGPGFALQNGGLGSTVSSDLRLIDVFTLLQLHGGTGTLGVSGLAEGGGGPAESFRLTGSVTVEQEAALAPEPSSCWLLLPGLMALALFRKRRSGAEVC